MTVKCEKFIQIDFRSKPEEAWNNLTEAALQFAEQIGEKNLISISHAVDINGAKSVFVWYRRDAAEYRRGNWLTEE